MANEYSKETEKENRSFNVRLVDGVIIVRFSIEKKEKWSDFEKSFKTFDEFTKYSKRFLKIK